MDIVKLITDVEKLIADVTAIVQDLEGTTPQATKINWQNLLDFIVKLLPVILPLIVKDKE